MKKEKSASGNEHSGLYSASRHTKGCTIATNRALRMPEPDFIQRKCSHCEEEEAQRKPLSSFIQRKEAGGKMTTTDSIHGQIQSTRGGGNAMPSNTKSFMETRFGADFSSVRIHSGAYASQLSNELNAQAFTVGNDIYFNDGKFSPHSPEGKHLLAHELAHTVQQGNKNAEHQVSRKLSVNNPSANIDNPTGTGKVQTNKDTVLDYLNTICPSGTVTISSAGDVAVSPLFCSAKPFSFSMGPIAVTAANVTTSATPVGCGCLCELASPSNTNNWRITVDDNSWPHTDFDDPAKAGTPGSGGTGGVVTAPSPNSQKLWGAVTKPGAFADIPPWLVLGHELCGHAWEGNTGDAKKDAVPVRGRGGHQETVGRENLLRAEHSLTLRGGFRDPFCGESFSNPVGTTPSKSNATLSSFLPVCKQWRKEYNKANKTSFKIEDPIPVKAGEKLPPP